MAHIHPAATEIELLLRECNVTRTRRGGPGGQHRNKVETAVVIHHLPSGISAEANERRSQEENRVVAIQRLRVRLAVQLRLLLVKESPLSDLWRSRSSSGKIVVSAAHPDFPTMLAEALDCLFAEGYQTSSTAKRLGVTSTSLMKLAAKSPEAFALIQRERAARGLPKLRPT